MTANQTATTDEHRRSLSMMIAEDTIAFLASGGVIKTYPAGLVTKDFEWHNQFSKRGHDYE